MSILTQLLERKITWEQAKAQIEGDVSKISNMLPPESAAVMGVVLADAKQAASNAIDLADSMAAPLLATGALAVGAAFDVAAKAYLGPLGPIVSPAAHDAIDRIRDGLKAEIDASALALKAQLAAPVAPAASAKWCG